MASRSFKPASYLASAAQGPNRSPRPSFTRTSSSSSTKSEDSIFSSLKALNLSDQSTEDKKAQRKGKGKGKENGSNIASSSPLGTNSPTSHRSYFEDRPSTPGRKRSQPIAIELPGRDPRAVYTPLSARGDLPGGYFPNHEEITRSYKTHPFSSHHQKHESSSDTESASEMSASALGSPVSDTTPRGPTNLVLSPFTSDSLMMPMGKYHPSNYKSNPTSSVHTPTINAPTSVLAPFPSNNLTIPKSLGKRSSSGRPGHERKNSDVKRKIQQYQREMMVQAQLARGSGSAMKAVFKDPVSPKLVPLGSPGPITPFELEESAGYLVAGSRPGGGAEEQPRTRESDIVDGIIRKEEERRQTPVGSSMI